jgi:hypothetical protein
MEGCRSNFKQFNPRASSTPEKVTAEIMNGAPGVVELEYVTKEK